MRLIKISPGEILLDEIEERDWLNRDIAADLGLSENDYKQFFQGKIQITGKLAVNLYKLTGSSAQFWLNLDAAYQKA